MGDKAVLIPYLFVCCLGFAGNVCTTGQILHGEQAFIARSCAEALDGPSTP